MNQISIVIRVRAFLWQGKNCQNHQRGCLLTNTTQLHRCRADTWLSLHSRYYLTRHEQSDPGGQLSGEMNFPGGEVHCGTHSLRWRCFPINRTTGQRYEDEKMVPRWPRREWAKSRLLQQLMLVLGYPSLCTCHYLVARKLSRANHDLRLHAWFSARVTMADKLDRDKSCFSGAPMFDLPAPCRQMTCVIVIFSPNCQ